MPDVALDGVVAIHVQEAASLCQTRIAQLRLPHVSLPGLWRLDNRLLAHFDGLSTAGESAQRLLDLELETPSRGAAFAFAVSAIESGRPEALERLWNLADDTPSVADGLMTALGWAEPRHLQGIVRDLLRSGDARRREAGLAVCAMHRTDPGLDKGPWLDDPLPAVRSRALRAVGELGIGGLASRLVAAADDNGECQFWSAWSAVLLGNRGVPLDALRQTAVEGGRPHRARAFSLTLQALDTPSAHAMLRDVAKDVAQLRWLIQGSGIAGEATYVPWLIGHMTTPETARGAGEAFTLITGADLDALQLWRSRPEDFESGPTADPDDENVELDADEGLMWPDPQKVERWWTFNAHRFQPGGRYFMGAPVTREHCLDVVKNGYQRQRVLAAHYLCLLEPGTPLFNTSAPAWRQQRLLAEMTR